MGATAKPTNADFGTAQILDRLVLACSWSRTRDNRPALARHKPVEAASDVATNQRKIRTPFGNTCDESLRQSDRDVNLLTVRAAGVQRAKHLAGAGRLLNQLDVCFPLLLEFYTYPLRASKL